MTQKLFLEQPYETEFQATVITSGNNGIMLDKTLFYATSGGQPGDTGFLIFEDSNDNMPVIASQKSDDGENVLHILPETCRIPRPGEVIKGKLTGKRVTSI